VFLERCFLLRIRYPKGCREVVIEREAQRKRSFSQGLCALFAFGVLTAARSANAESHEADAERLFREGQKLLEEHRFGQACPKFESAYKKDGALGTLLNLAFCHEAQGALWSAWLEFREAELKAGQAHRRDRLEFARAHLAELEKGFAKVVVDVPLGVSLSEVLVEERRVWGAETASVFVAEPGLRKFTFRSADGASATSLIQVERGDRPLHVAVPTLVHEPSSPRLTVEAPAPPPVAVPVRSAESFAARRTLGWVAIGGGVGVAALGAVTGAAAYFGPCGHQRCAADERDSASTTAAVSTASFVVSSALVIFGVVLVLTSSDAPLRARSSPAQIAF
jgi:hypothetical protein